MRVEEILQSKDASLFLANAASRSYEGGKYHSELTFDKPEAVAINLAGPYAALAMAEYLQTVTEATLTDCFEVICNDNLSEEQWDLACRFANATWRSCQPFRDLTSNPLNRISRSVNSAFNSLPPDEVAKDRDQIIGSAKAWLQLLNS